MTFKAVQMDKPLKFGRKNPFCIVKLFLTCSLVPINPAQAFIDPSSTPIYASSPYSQYQNPVYLVEQPYISIDAVTYGTGTGIETSTVGYSGQYQSSATGAFGLWQVGNSSQTTTGGALNFWANSGNNPVLSLSFGLGGSMKSYLGIVSRRVTVGNIVEAFMWTRIDEQAYWNAFDTNTLQSSSITPLPALEQYLLWIRPTTSADLVQQQVNSAPVLDSLKTELNAQIAAGGGTAPEPLPSPMPLLGIGMAFNYSRRLRRRTCYTSDLKDQA